MNLSIVSIYDEQEQEYQRLRIKHRPELIQYLKKTVKHLLSQSLINQVASHINPSLNITNVTPAMELKVGNQKTECLSLKTSIMEVYDREEINGRLLILGQLGAGKSTILYQLAQGLIERAENDQNHPIPILFDLSKWVWVGHPNISLLEYLLDELTLIGFEYDFARSYLENQQIIPLLDGLDELESSKRETCSEHIRYFGDRPLVLCDNLQALKSSAIKKKFSGILTLQSLSNEQITNYLQETKSVKLQTLIERDEDAQTLAHIPLFLNLMVLTEQEISSLQWQQLHSEKHKSDYLVACYLVKMIGDSQMIGNKAYDNWRSGWQVRYREKIANAVPPKKRVPRSYRRYLNHPTKSYNYLSWIASQLEKHQFSLFFVDKIQPKGLKKGSLEKDLFQIIFRLIAGLIGFTVVELAYNYVIYVNYLKGIENFHLQTTPLLYAPMFILVYGMNLISKDENGHGVKIAFWRRIPFWRGFNFNPLSSTRLQIGLNLKTQPNQDIWFLICSNFFLLFIFLILAFTIFWGLENGARFLNLINGDLLRYVRAILAFITVVLFLCREGLQHLSLRIVLTLSGYAPWNYARFLNYCTEQSILQRVGGGYRFIHSIFRKHLVKYKRY
ncbi:MAG: NACHT domain-containing NTPase [Microcystaceae cyanobacterium]